MTPEEMQKRSAEKVQQVLNLMKMLHITVEARQRVNPEGGFLENIVFWMDNEAYPKKEIAGPDTTPLAAEEPPSTGESDKHA